MYYCCELNYNDFNENHNNLNLDVLKYGYYPFAFIVSLYPKIPDNFWGGVLGMTIGTHKYCNIFCKYNQNIPCCFHEYLALHKYNNALYNDDDLRIFISNFISNEPNYTPMQILEKKNSHKYIVVNTDIA